MRRRHGAAILHEPLDDVETGQGRPRGPVELSVVTAARDERGNVDAFLSGALEAVEQLGVRAEVVFVDDGSSDGTSEAVEDFIRARQVPAIRLVRHARPSGLSAALATGFAHANGTLVCVVPADLESWPQDDIPLLYRAMDTNVDVVCGRRLRRGDGKDLSSRVYALGNRILFGVRAQDGNWIKLIRREKLDGVPIYSDWHRYLLAILTARGARIKEVETVWHRRRFGRSKYGLARVPAGLAGAIAVRIFLSFAGRPLLFSLWVALWLVVATLLAGVVALGCGPASLLWVPAWALCGSMLAASAVALGLGVALEFLRWEKGPPKGAALRRVVPAPATGALLRDP